MERIEVVRKEGIGTIDMEGKPVKMYRVRDVWDDNRRNRMCDFSLWNLRT